VPKFSSNKKSNFGERREHEFEVSPKGFPQGSSSCSGNAGGRWLINSLVFNATQKLIGSSKINVVDSKTTTLQI